MICLNRFQTSNQQLDIKRNHSDFFTRNNAQQMTHGTIIRKNSEYIPAFRPYVIYQNISFSFVILSLPHLFFQCFIIAFPVTGQCET